MSWEDSYDKWRTTPPEPPISKFKCEHCKQEFYPGDKVYDIDGEILCYECAIEWVEGQFRYALESECFGDE